MANEIGKTEVQEVVQTLVASIVQQTLKEKSMLLGTITDYSRFATPGADAVKIPRRDQFAAANKAENTDLTAQEMTFSADTISLNLHKAIYAKLERIAGVQANVNVQAEIITEMAAEHALQVDKDIYTELKLASASGPDHRIAFANATSLGKADIIEARKLLNSGNVPMDARFLAVNPLHEAELLAIAEFVEADKYGSSEGLVNGELGRLFGFRVVMSTVVEDNNVVAYHSSAVGYAGQLAPEFRSDFDLKSASDEYLLHQIYGVEVLDSGKRQILLGTAV